MYFTQLSLQGAPIPNCVILTPLILLSSFLHCFWRKKKRKTPPQKLKSNLALEIISNVKHYKLEDSMLQKAAIQKISEIWIRQDLLVTWFFLSTIRKLLQFSLVCLLLHVLLCLKQYRYNMNLNRKKITVQLMRVFRRIVCAIRWQ